MTMEVPETQDDVARDIATETPADAPQDENQPAVDAPLGPDTPSPDGEDMATVPDSQFYNDFGDPERDVASEKQEEEDYERSLAQMYAGVIRAGMEKYSEVRKGQPGGAGFIFETAASFVEDIYNTGADTLNYITRLLGAEEDVVERSQIVADNIPNDVASTTVREAIKFMGGYAGILNKMQSMRRAKSALGTGTQIVGAGVMTDFLLYKPEMDALTVSFLKKAPFVGEAVDYIFSPDSEREHFEQRLQFAMGGTLDSAAAEGVIRAFRAVRAAKVSKDFAKAAEQVEPPPVPREGEPPPVPRDEPPEVPRTTEEPPPVPRDEPGLETMDQRLLEADLVGDGGLPLTPEQAENIVRRTETGEGGVNTLRTYDSEGNRVYQNLNRLNTTDDLRRQITNMVEQNPEHFARERITRADLEDAARAFEMTPEKMMRLAEEGNISLGQILASRRLALEMNESFAHMGRQRFIEGADISDDAIRMAYANVQAVQKVANNFQTLASAMMRESAVDIGVSRNMRQNKEYMDYLKQVYGDTPLKVAELIADTPLPSRALENALIKYPTQTLEYLNQLRYNYLLMLPPLHVRNILSSLAMTTSSVASSYTAATINSVKRSAGFHVSPASITFGDATAEAAGLAQGFMETSSIIANKWRMANRGTNVPTLEELQAASFRGVRRGANKISGIDYTTVSETGRVPDFYSLVTDSLGKGSITRNALQFEDQVNKHLSATATLRREAYRKARLETMENTRTPEEFTARVKQLMDEPTEYMMEQAFRSAESHTFTKPVEGEVLTTLYKLTEGNPLGQMIFPFARTNLNVIGETLERVPVANFFVKSYRDKMYSLDPAVREKAQAEWIVTSTVFGGLAYWLHSMDAITGSRPTGQGRWQMYEGMGYQPSSIKTKDGRFVEYRPETPQGAILRMVADLAHLNDLMDGENPALYSEVGAGAIAAMAQMYKPEYMVDMIGNLYDAYSSDDPQALNRFLRVGTGVATSYAPWSGAARTILRNYTEQGKFKREVYDPTSVLNDFWNQILNIYHPEQLAQKRNVIGEPIKHKIGLGPSVISPLGVTELSDDPVLHEMDRVFDFSRRLVGSEAIGEVSRQNITDPIMPSLTMPSRVLNISGTESEVRSIRLRPAEYEKLVLYSAGIHPDLDESLSLRNVLKEQFESRSYKEASQAKQALMIKSIVEKYQEMGKDLYMGDEGMLEEIRQFYKDYREFLREKY